MSIVTRDSLQAMINRDNQEFVMHVVGRALVVLFNRQTAAEKQENTTINQNGIGFTGSDGRSGVLCAKSYLKHGKLLDWQVEKWTKLEKSGYSRLTKYWKQLDEAAHEKNKMAA